MEYPCGGDVFEVESINETKAIGALITTQADTMSAIRYRMSKAVKAMKMD